MNKDDREIVAAVRARLADRIGKNRFEVWFGPATQLSVQGESLIVTVPNQFFQDWLRTNFRKDLEASAAEVVGKALTLEFRTATAAEVPAVAQAKPSNPTKPNVPIAAPKPAPTNHAPVILKSSQGQPSQPERAVRRPLACLHSFVTGNSNCLAHKAAQLTAEQPGSYSPLLIHGPTGTGKTHLLEGILTAFRQDRPRASAVYFSAEQFTSCFLEALHGSGLPSFRRKCRGVELLVIDDVQFFANKRATLVELLHTVDTLMRAGRQLVFAADRSPAALKSLGSELAARFSGGMACRIEPPDYVTRLGIVKQLSVRLGIALADEIASFIAAHFTTQSRELAGAIKRLQATSLAHGRPITLALAQEALGELIDHQGPIVKLADIEKAVCDVFGLTPESLQSSRKAKTVSHPRMLAMWLARKLTRAPLSEIGSYFGKRSHSTVIFAQKKIDSWIANGKPLAGTDRPLNLEESIRRVEENLRAG